ASRKSRFKLVREEDAPAPIREIFDDIKRTLGVPHVNLLFQAYAAIPGFLERHWQAFGPMLARQRFFDLAERLRAEAYTSLHNYFSVPDLMAEMTQVSDDDRREIASVVDLFHYNDPPLLLLAAAQLCAFDPCALDGGGAPGTVEHPAYAQRAVLIDEDKAQPPVRKIFDDMKRALDIPYVN